QYFHEIVRSNLEAFDVQSFLPEQVLEELRAEPMVDRALGSLEDLATCSQYLRESNRLVRYLQAALSAPSKVTAFAEFRRARERSLMIENRVAQLRGRLTQLEEEVVGTGGAQSEVGQVREQRRAIERAIGRLPTRGDDFDARDEQA